MNRSKKKFMGLLCSALTLGATFAFAPQAMAQCGGQMTATPNPSAGFVIDDSLVINVTFGPLGNAATINAVIVTLDCQNASGCDSACIDDGNVLQYNGDDTIAGNTCGQSLSTGLGTGDTFQNTITFTFANPINLAAGSTCSFNFGVTIKSFSNDATPKAITGTARTSGTCENTLPLAACGSYIMFLVDPQIRLVKNVSPTGPICVGGNVTYTYTVTNPGDVALGNIILWDDNGTDDFPPGDGADDFQPSFVGGDTNGNSMLDPGETWTYSAVRAPGVGTTTNNATVTGDYVNAGGTTTVDWSDDATIVVNPRPTCSITPTPGVCETQYCVNTDACGSFTVAWTGPGGYQNTGTCITLGAGDAAGTYSAVVTDCNGCTSTDACSFNFVPPVAPSCEISVAECPSRVLTVTPTNCPDCTVEWGTANSIGGNCVLNGSTGPMFDPGAIAVTTIYCVVVTSHCPPTDGGTCNVEGCTSTCYLSIDPCGSDFQGRTPGFWKQSQHFGHWPCPYCPQANCGSAGLCPTATKFCDVFTCPTRQECPEAYAAFNNKTLLQVLGQGGGGFKALGRHAVAALLNAAHPDVNYFLDVDGVINAVNQAIANCSPDALHNQLAENNELEGGPLGGQRNCSHALAQTGCVDFRSTLDLNGDTLINGDDVAVIMANWNRSGSDLPGDLDRDRRVNNNDLQIMLYFVALEN